MSSRPLVSIVIPMLDERAHIDACLDGFGQQTWPVSRLELLVVDGGSTDGSRELVERRRQHEPWIRLIDNPAHRASSAFNRGVEGSRGDVVCLFSAHGVPEPDFVEASVAALARWPAAGVGGRYEHVGVTRRSRAIGLAMASPFGMASKHRFARRAQSVDTIGHPVYRREALEAVGPFDETLERNSDYELNWRLRRAGFRLMFDPTIASIYRPRATWRELAGQFFRYGRGKARVVTEHPDSLRVRHLAPPLAISMLLMGPLGARTPIGRRILAIAVAGYLGTTVAATRVARPGNADARWADVAATFPIMHACWGAGFMVGLVAEVRCAANRSACNP